MLPILKERNDTMKHKCLYPLCSNKKCGIKIASVLLALLLTVPSLLLCSCDKGNSGGEGAAESDAAEIRIEYLNERISELEATLISLKSNSYVQDTAYRAQIAALERELASLRGQSGSADTQKPTSDPDQTDKETDKVTQSPTDTPSGGQSDKITLLFTVSGGKATVTGYTGSGKYLLIPSTLGGYPVEAVADNAFSRTEFESIEIDEGVKRLGWFAFSDNTALKSVILPSSIERAEYGVFNGCSGKLTVYCETNTYIATYAKSYGINTRDKSK